MRRAAFSLALALLPAAAMPDVISPAPDAVQVTIYRDPDARIGAPVDDEEDEQRASTGLAMVTETRTIDIPAGLSKVIFLGVADAIVPQTAGIDGLPAIILESNFDYDLLTPGAVIAQSHGEHVRHVRTDKATGRVIERDAIIRSGPDGIVLEIDGRIEALNCSGLNEKLIFARVPQGLADEPQLSLTIKAEAAGRHTIQLSYLALGLDWAADYIASINPDGRTLNLTGWITLVNHASTTFANTPAAVVAGRLERNKEETQPPGATRVEERISCWLIGSFAPPRAPVLRDLMREAFQSDNLQPVSSIQEVTVTGMRAVRAKLSELGDYKLYTLAEPTTIAARQSKQVSFLSQANVPFTRLYTFKLEDEAVMQDNDFVPRRPVVTLRLKNEKNEGLGKPLPAGTLSVMEASDLAAAAGGRVLAGEDTLDDTPVGLPFDVELGHAMDVWLEPRVTAEYTVERGDRSEEHTDIEVRIGNDKPVPVVLEFRQPHENADFRIVRESKSHTLKSGDPLWTFRLQPGARVVLKYTVSVWTPDTP